LSDRAGARPSPLRDLGYFARELRRRPVGFLLRKGATAMARRGRGLMAALGRNPYRATSHGASGVAPRLLVSAEAPLERARRDWPDRVEEIVHTATAEADLRFRVLSTEIDGASGIDWHADPQSGVRWPPRFHTRFRYGELLDRARPSDVKIPWELSRLQCLPRLALAFRLTGEERFVGAARSILSAWDDANPVGYGVNWAVGMEAGLRAVSMIIAQDLLMDGDEPRELAGNRWRALLAEHGRFLHRNMEYSDVNGNHMTACLLGLLYLGVFAPWDREASSWTERAVECLHVEIEAQTYPDGVCHEGSIPYHGLVAEMFLHALLVGERCGIEFSAGYRDRLHRMLAFTRAYLKPGGSVPRWGDADDGRVLSLGGELGEHHRSLLALGAVLLQSEDLWEPGGPLPFAAAVLAGCGATAVSPGARAPASSASADSDATTRDRDGGCRAFVDGGFFVLRRDDSYCLIDCGDVGMRGRGGHGHNDALSVELTLAGHDVLVDTGCASYTRSVDERVACLSGKAHNAVVVDGREPAGVSLARIPHAGPCPVEQVAFEADAARFVGRHFGYGALGIERYERRVELPQERASAIITDELDGDGEHHVRWSFHLSPRWREVGVEGSTAMFEHDDGEGCLLRIRWQPDTLRAHVTSSPVYPAYGRSAARCRLVLEADRDMSFTAQVRFRVLVSEGNRARAGAR
jgi:hypothetical protein